MCGLPDGILRPLTAVFFAAWLTAFCQGSSIAQTAPVSPAPPPAATPATPEPQSPAATPTPTPAPEPPASADASSAQQIEITARPVALLRGSSSWDDGYANLTAAFKKIEVEIGKAGLKANGRPMTAFLETDDQTFRYEAMIPLEAGPAGKSALTQDVLIGRSPAGKAIKFQHRAAYDEIDSPMRQSPLISTKRALRPKTFFSRNI